jgi:hypothetical protein
VKGIADAPDVAVGGGMNVTVDCGGSGKDVRLAEQDMSREARKMVNKDISIACLIN